MHAVDLKTKLGFDEPFGGNFRGGILGGGAQRPVFEMCFESCDAKFLKENKLVEFKFRTYCSAGWR